MLELIPQARLSRFKLYKILSPLNIYVCVHVLQNCGSTPIMIIIKISGESIQWCIMHLFITYAIEHVFIYLLDIYISSFMNFLCMYVL